MTESLDQIVSQWPEEWQQIVKQAQRRPHQKRWTVSVPAHLIIWAETEMCRLRMKRDEQTETRDTLSTGAGVRAATEVDGAHGGEGEAPESDAAQS